MTDYHIFKNKKKALQMEGFYFNYIINLLLYDSRFLNVISGSYKIDHVYPTWYF